jgi:hypothetical protein
VMQSASVGSQSNAPTIASELRGSVTRARRNAS